MVPLSSLLLPIALSAVAVFLASSLVHMVIGWHKHDLIPVSNDAEIQAALRPFKLAPGDYGIPWAGGMDALKSPEFQAKRNAGPNLFMTISPAGGVPIGKSLALWFVYACVVSLFAAYVGAHALGSGVPYLHVFRFVGTTAFLGYSMALFQNSIWWGRGWGMTIRSVLDGLLYALLTAGIFGWLWPR